MIYVHQPAAAVVVPSMKIAVDSPLVMKNSRHTIAEAGFDTILANLQKSKKRPMQARPGTASLEYKGLEKAAGVERPCHHFIRRTPSGETWNIYLDPRSMLPRLVRRREQAGRSARTVRLLRYSREPDRARIGRRVQPGRRWGEGKGFFSRIAEGSLWGQCAEQQCIDNALTAKLTD